MFVLPVNSRTTSSLKNMKPSEAAAHIKTFPTHRRTLAQSQPARDDTHSINYMPACTQANGRYSQQSNVTDNTHGGKKEKKDKSGMHKQSENNKTGTGVQKNDNMLRTAVDGRRSGT